MVRKRWKKIPNLGWLQIRLLLLIREKPRYGFEVMDVLAKNRKKPSPGTIYPALNALEKKGLIQGQYRPGLAGKRKVYELTDIGKDVLSTLLFWIFEPCIETLSKEISSYMHSCLSLMKISDSSKVLYACIEYPEFIHDFSKVVGEKGEVTIMLRMLRKFDWDLPINCSILENPKSLNTIPNNFFDAALYFYGLEPLIPVAENFQALLREMYRTLAPKGILTICFIDPRENLVSRALLKGLLGVDEIIHVDQLELKQIVAQYFEDVNIASEREVFFITGVKSHGDSLE